ncbi:SRPBCC family protein [uncultured Thiothrix sp.]|uniref:SRPBCC family protein n=1 Tax=uncultured Thiothrix sp. TaxID=223185 RepID=UPI00262A28A2|nr:SRPBCC family protein [uncultured Thiothrix sp.]
MMEPLLLWILVGVLVLLIVVPFLIGLMLSPYQRATRVELVKAPIDATWGALSDLSRQTEWRTDLKSVQLKDDDEGMRWVENLAHGGKITARKQKEVLNKEIIIQLSKGSQVIGTREAVLSAVPGGTRITFTQTTVTKNPWQRLNMHMGSKIDKHLQSYIEQFKARFTR